MTDNRTTELLPCPFCGCEAETDTDHEQWWVVCRGCRLYGNHYTTEAEAIAAWNARVERTCEPSWVLQGETQTQEFWRCECGNCGECFGVEDRSSFPLKMTIGEVDIPNFCPNCGWKVVSE